jgi:hypothetical protein
VMALPRKLATSLMMPARRSFHPPRVPQTHRPTIRFEIRLSED